MNETTIAVLLLIACTQSIFIFGQISSTDRAQLDFAVKLLQKIAKDDKSVVFSPLSVSTSLFMVYLAAHGQTKQQLQDVLGGTASLPEVRLHFAKLLFNIQKARNENYTLNVANRIYIRQEFPIKESFQRVLRWYFNETLYKFDFGQREEFAQQVNNWISTKTNDKIRNVISSNDISSDSRMLFMNAIYFKGTWAAQFFAKMTQQGEFYTSENETKLIPMMVKTAEVPYYEDKFAKVIRLPYIGDEVEMVFILPQIRFDLSNLIRKLTGDDLLRYIRNATIQSTFISLPKFRVEGKLNLKKALKKIGITYAFSEKANFEELVCCKAQISVSKIMHAGFIEVDEKGTESAAATVIGLDYRSLPGADFIADQPFLFAIVKDLKTVLFAGQFVN